MYRMLQDGVRPRLHPLQASTVTRRIERRLALARTSNIDEYVRRLKSDRDELDVLYRDLLIGVTRFFRDEKAFQLIEDQVLPELFENQKGKAPLRIWVAGCATGEEVYTLAILSPIGAETRRGGPSRFSRRRASRLARTGRPSLYDEEAVANVSCGGLSRYFLRTGSMYQVVRISGSWSCSSSQRDRGAPSRASI